ncbi:MAG: DNA alkylation repair protein [Clostridium sp.]|nr:DNA alkylation repair protein [Clostridium sp.]
MDNHETILSIKKELRLAMNGVASTLMRERGIDYKVNFGVELPRLRDIASRFTPDHALARDLWKENVRECKILATMLQPTDSFLPEIADIWMESITQPELAQQLVMNLMAEMPYASDKAFRWMADDRPMFRYAGFLLIARLLMRGAQLNEDARQEFLDQAEAALHDESLFVRKAAQNAMTRIG